MTPNWPQGVVADANLLANDVSSSPVPLRRLEGARILWFDREALADGEQGGDRLEEASRRLLRKCAFVVAEGRRADVVGWADRYGGAGIGRHGGSGRSVLLNGYSVKGVGPTPLLGIGESPSHSTGGAYLEEAIREVVTSKTLRDRLPYGVVPIVAIIDTGIDQKWRIDGRDLTERRVLIVRRFSLRFAHLMRAYGYRPPTFQGKRDDAARVRYNAKLLTGMLGADSVGDLLGDGLRRWAEQIGYAMVSGIGIGGSPSNLDVRGSVIDFGAVSALPGDANYVLSPGNTVVGQFGRAMAAAGSLISDLDRAVPNELDLAEDVVTSAMALSFEDGIISGLFGRLGLAGSGLPPDRDSPDRERILRDYLHFHRLASRRRVELTDACHDVTEPDGGLEGLFDDGGEAALRPLSTTIRALLASRGVAVPVLASSTRRASRELLRKRIHQALSQMDGDDGVPEIIQHFCGIGGLA